MVARAITQGGLDDTDVASTSSTPATTISLEDHRVARQPIRWGGWAAAAAVVVLLLGLGTVIVRATSSSSSYDAASSSGTVADDAGGTGSASATPESAQRQSGGENATAESRAGVAPPTTAIPTGPQLALLRPLDLGAAASIDDLVDRALTAQGFVGSSSALDAAHDQQVTEDAAGDDDLMACLDSRSIDGTIDQWLRGTVDGRTIDVLVIDRPVIGREVLAIAALCTIERARGV
jgi:hypothetical protein